MLRAIILIIALVTIKGDKCVKRSFGENGSVCVCNSTYCDTIDVPPIKKDQFLWYKSTKDGKMMEFSFNKFSHEEQNNKNNKCEKVILTLNPYKKYQKTCGFGGAMTDSAALNIKTLSNSTQHNLLESYYGVTGIGYTFARIPIAGTDFSTRPYTYDDVPDDTSLEHFSLVEEDYLKIQYLHHIQNIMPKKDNLKIFTTSWSAPPWMKSSNDIKWGSLEEKYYQIYADYILKFFDAYKQFGINIWGISPSNIPVEGFVADFPFNSMGWVPIQVAKWAVNHLAPTLSKAGYNDLIYIAVEDQRFLLPAYPVAMFQSKAAKELFSGISFHWYTDEIFPPSVLTITHDLFPDKFILMSEAATGIIVTNFGQPPVDLGSWKRGEQYMLNIIQNLSHWVCGWIDWNLVLDEKGGPTWSENNMDSPIIVNPDNDEFYKQPMFYALSHFSKFLPFGSDVISSAQENCFAEKLIHSIAFLTPEQEIVIVIANTQNVSIPLTIKQEQVIKDKIIDINLPPKSFHTITYLI